MPRATKPSFIIELPLKVDSAQDRELKARFQAARQLYNACLGEAMTRLNLVRNSEAYQTARKIPKTFKKQRSEAFAKARVAYRYSEYDLHAFASITAKASQWIAEKVDANTQQTIATRAFRASERVLLGLAKKVRFKISNRFRSVEGKSNRQGLRWKDNQVVWCGFIIQPIIDWSNPVIKHGLESPVKYVRLLCRELNGKKRWFVQLINEGFPSQKPQNYLNTGVVGIDVNISNIAFVADNKAGLLPFTEGVPTFEKEIRQLQRQMERSRRATNPDNYEPDFESKRGNKVVKKKGTLKRGARQQIKSTRYLKAAAKKRELEKRKTAYATY
jgi:putative transposase